MTHTVLDHILRCHSARTPMLAVLLDPDKPQACHRVIPYLSQTDLVLVGGSSTGGCENLVRELRRHTLPPIVLFPGNISQFTPEADALLYLSLLSSPHADHLITPHIQSALEVRSSGIEIIPMGYILVDGGTHSSVERFTQSLPIPQEDPDTILRTAVAGEMLGKRLLYLEAGSGAARCVSPSLIRMVRHHVSVPLIVGGGICSVSQMTAAWDAGADIVVIGNCFEQNPQAVPSFTSAKSHYHDARS